MTHLILRAIGVFLYLLALTPVLGQPTKLPSVNPPNSDAARAVFTSAAEALGMMLQVVANLEDNVRSKDLVSIHSEDVVLSASVAAIQRQASRLAPDQQAAFITDLTNLVQHVSALHFAGDTGKQAQAEGEMVLVREAFGRIQARFSSKTVDDAQNLASRYTCPTHHDIQGKRTDMCVKCGQPMEQRVRLLPEFCGFPAGGQTVAATVRIVHPLVVGDPAKAVLQLRRKDGAPVYPSDLITAHTEKIHLFIIDDSLSDYHHLHPRATTTAGDYEFSFTPRQPGPYQVWADVRPEPMGLQEYAATTISAANTESLPVNRIVTNKVAIDGLNYELVFASETLAARKPIQGRLHITRTDGTTSMSLEPLMGAFAHFAGFYDDRKTILHLHPKGVPVSDTERSKLDIEFIFYAPRQGFVRIFAQVQIGGVSKFAAFGLDVLP